jgi:hypothetical protein
VLGRRGCPVPSMTSGQGWSRDTSSQDKRASPTCSRLRKTLTSSKQVSGRATKATHLSARRPSYGVGLHFVLAAGSKAVRAACYWTELIFRKRESNRHDRAACAPYSYPQRRLVVGTAVRITAQVRLGTRGRRLVILRVRRRCAAARCRTNSPFVRASTAFPHPSRC